LGTTLVALIYALASHRPTISVAVPLARNGTAPVIPPVPPLTSGGAPPTGLLRGVVSQQHAADLGQLATILLVLLGITSVASGVLGWIASGRVLRPVREITSAAQTISAGNLSKRLPVQGPDDEFRALGETLNDLLARLEAAFESQRRFVANASHELRTPLTVERTLLEVALSDPDASAATLRRICEELLASGRDHARLLEALLTLASSERGLELREALDLGDLAAAILPQFSAELERRNLELSSALAPAPTSGDRALIERLIGNLLDNAVSYNAHGGQVAISTATTENGSAVLSVSNSGPVIAAGSVERLLEPFQRLEPGRAADAEGHHGLGLSIVRAIAIAHRARLSAEPRPEGGLTVTVSFPPAGV
jgi:signal transduction histidine kinase